VSKIWSRVKFVRNLKGVKFEPNITDLEQKEILKLCLDATTACGLKGSAIGEMSESVVNNLLASDFVENDFVYNHSNHACAQNKNVTVQINGKNHIEILAKDGDIFSAYKNAKQIDKKLCNKLNFAYTDKYGFLTPDIKNIGSGMSVEVKMLLPALSKVDALRKLPNANEKLVFDITCLDRTSGLCVISTRASLGYTEKQICELTNAYIEKIVKLEIETSKNLAKDIDEILDKSSRAKAILKNCVKLSGAESYILLGDILIAINAGVEREILPEQINKCLNIIKIHENNFKTLAKEIQKIII